MMESSRRQFLKGCLVSLGLAMAPLHALAKAPKPVETEVDIFWHLRESMLDRHVLTSVEFGGEFVVYESSDFRQETARWSGQFADMASVELDGPIPDGSVLLEFSREVWPGPDVEWRA